MGKYLIGFQLMVVGMGTVLITLYILSLFMRLNTMLWNRDSSKKSRDTENITELEEIEDKLPAQKVAVISAAVYSCLQKEKKSYRIISIKRRKTEWKR